MTTLFLLTLLAIAIGLAGRRPSTAPQPIIAIHLLETEERSSGWPLAVLIGLILLVGLGSVTL